MTLDELVRDLAKRGELTHLSLIPRGTGWSASYTAASPGGSYGTAEADDPVAALLAAVACVKLRKLSPKKARPEIDITAAVNDAGLEPEHVEHKPKIKTSPETAEDWLPVGGPR